MVGSSALWYNAAGYDVRETYAMYRLPKHLLVMLLIAALLMPTALVMGCPSAPPSADPNPDPEPDPEPEPPQQTSFGWPIDDEGWADLQPSEDTRRVYVSNDGNDDAPGAGLSIDKPAQTLAKGISLLRDGYPDWLLLRRGDTWPGERIWLGQNGRSQTEPCVVTAYRDPNETPGNSDDRPTIQGEWRVMGDYVAVVSLKTVNGAVGRFKGNHSLIEDCLFDNAMVIAQQIAGVLENTCLRRCVIIDSHTTLDQHRQGVYCENGDGVFMEQCLFDHNGWSETVPDAEPTAFNHNVYIQYNNTNVVFRDNISARSSSHGVQVRPGGVVTGNVFVQNALGLSLGSVYGGSPTVPGGVDCVISNNVFLNGEDIERDPPGMARGGGLGIANLRSGGIISDNIIAHNTSAFPFGHGITFDGENGDGVHGLTVSGNIIYNWQNPIFARGIMGSNLTNVTIADNQLQDAGSTHPDYCCVWLVDMVEDPVGAFTFSGNHYYSYRGTQWFSVWGAKKTGAEWLAEKDTDPSATTTATNFVDPTRDLATYSASLGGAGTNVGFYTEARKQRRDYWREEYTAQAVVAYMRAGFTPQ